MPSSEGVVADGKARESRDVTRVPHRCVGPHGAVGYLRRGQVPVISCPQERRVSTVLVTGAAGFIGSNFVRYWRQVHPGDRVVALDALTYAGVRESLDGPDGQLLDGVEFVHGSIANTDLIAYLLRAHSVDVVVNFPPESHNSLAILRPGDFFATNVMGTQALLEAVRRVGVSRFHHISTCEVYGDLSLDADEA